MAVLICKDSGKSIYLRDFHRFGRLAHSVDTLLNYPEVTRIHAVIEWVEPHWYIRDLSKNGVWLNGKKLEKQTKSLLSLHDNISFSEVSKVEYQLVSIEPPKDLLLPVGNDSLDVIELERYHFLPNNQDPKIIVYFDPNKYTWCYENTDDHQLMTLEDSDIITIDAQQWQLFKAEMTSQENTVDLSPPASTDDIEFIFSLSLDEEQTELKVKHNDELQDFDVRSHHYLTVLLARYKLADIKNHFAPEVQGWVQVKKLARDLGINECHVNIQIHRARKQFIESFNFMSADTLIERKRGKVRFGGEHYVIYKGQACESTE
ncbi:phosphopeptide-binding protein [Pseudoalteromonas sp. NCCP-2140]|uniref:FHA domain-containing protein n=1 Tax=Pseudoalteromonas sp. NCCP-2140 TaxID=2942288 RepID=UPI00203FC43F|nr:FHA domain-containing protein [Pseudoalteromonas sp. NCCP-2140]GKW54387.1 phosphopeptide-binding protein [Pseudoalteromonas sp. NCCP-2140]